VGNVGPIDGDRYAELTEELFRTVPTTLAGALALSEVVLDDDACEEDARMALESVAACLRSHRGRIEGVANVWSG
jgi:hypothetical protein